MPLIPPFFPNNKFITDFKETLELLNSFFSEQCSLLKNECEFHVMNVNFMYVQIILLMNICPM